MDSVIVDLIRQPFAIIPLIIFTLSFSFIIDSLIHRRTCTRLPRTTKRVIHYGLNQPSVEKYNRNLRGRFSWEVIIGFG